ncbi:hypothetical protein [Streptomyces sp. KL116D]|uniref:hypothetical protein n=1 Tax=Streptomyces sp. KL116D TaxID=3045152 RepID=UPI0035581DA4
MGPNGATPSAYARLADAYWIDTPRPPHTPCEALCQCPLDTPPPQGPALRLRYIMISLASTLITIGLVCTLA